MTRKLLWLCPGCGEILEKSAETAEVIPMLADVSGQGSCPGCGESQSTKWIYAGEFDFAMSDEELRVILAHERHHLEYDAKAKCWMHRGMRLLMQRDVERSRHASALDFSSRAAPPARDPSLEIEKGRGIAPSRMPAKREKIAGQWRGVASLLIVIAMLAAAWVVFASSAREGHTGVFAEGHSGVLIEHVESEVGVILMPSLPELARLCRRFSGDRHELILDELDALESAAAFSPDLSRIAVAGRESYAATSQRSWGRALLAFALLIFAMSYFAMARRMSRTEIDSSS